MRCRNSESVTSVLSFGLVTGPKPTGSTDPLVIWLNSSRDRLIKRHSNLGGEIGNPLLYGLHEVVIVAPGRDDLLCLA